MRSTLLFALTLLTMACAAGSAALPEVTAGHTVQLVVGDVATVTPTSVRVRLNGVNDSRCPADVVCIQAGDAMIVVLFTGAGAQRADTLRLNGSPRSAIYGGYRFEVVSVDPYPKQGSQLSAQTVGLQVDLSR